MYVLDFRVLLGTHSNKKNSVRYKKTLSELDLYYPLGKNVKL